MTYELLKYVRDVLYNNVLIFDKGVEEILRNYNIRYREWGKYIVVDVTDPYIRPEHRENLLRVLNEVRRKRKTKTKSVALARAEARAEVKVKIEVEWIPPELETRLFNEPRTIISISLPISLARELEEIKELLGYKKSRLIAYILASFIKSIKPKIQEIKQEYET